MTMAARVILIAVGCCLLATSVHADLVLPARLDVVEVSPGELDVTFTMPVVNGKKPKLEAVFSPRWQLTAEPDVTGTSNSYTMHFVLRAERTALTGEAILVQGLLGTPTDVAFSLKLLDGREYLQVLRAARSGFLVPDPPALSVLTGESLLGGMRRLLANGPIWLFLLAAAMSGVSLRSLMRVAAVVGLAHVCGQWMARQDWIGSSLLIANLFALTMALVPALALAGARLHAEQWLKQVSITAVLLGLMHGAARPETLTAEVLSHGEQIFAVVFFGVGFGAAWILVSVIGRELFGLVSRLERRSTGIGTWIGAGVVGFLLVEMAGVWVERSTQVEGFYWLVVAGAVLGLAFGRSRATFWAGLSALLVVGCVMGLRGEPVPLRTTLIFGPIAFLAAIIVSARPVAGRWPAALAGLAVLGTGWLVAVSSSEISARPLTLLGDAALASVAALVICRVPATTIPTRFGRTCAAAAVGLAVIGQIGGYADWFDQELATEAALGWIRLPLLTVGLVVLAVVMWPRRRRVLSELGMERARPITHWVALGLALFLLPFGTIRVSNPMFEPDAPRGDSARRVLTSVLSDTYRAFNLEDEGELYDQLDLTVAAELIDDVYLDSRRRLTAGTREGAKVAVRDVRVVEVGEPSTTAPGSGDFSYECVWRVVARVSHLQHVHHRQNLYRGILTLRVDADRWKISGLELLSEDRSVVSWSGS